MACPVALLWLSGATTYIFAILDNSLANSIIPYAYIPSSLVINIFIKIPPLIYIYFAISITSYQFI